MTSGRINMHEVQLSGSRRASYETVGTGPPLLMFPGGPGFPSLIVREDAELLAGDFTVYLIDPPGTGSSTPASDPRDYSHLGHAHFYNEVREALGLDEVAVHGVSFGAVCALTFAGLFPRFTSRAIGVSTFGIGTEVDASEGGAAAAEMERLLARHEAASWYPEARGTLDAFAETAPALDDAMEFKRMTDAITPLYVAHPDRPDVAERLERRRQRSFLPHIAAIKEWESGLYQSMDLRPLLEKIQCPVLLIAGELDFIAGPVQSSTLAGHITSCDLAVIPDCGHLPAIEEREAYRQVTLDWCRRELKRRGEIPEPGSGDGGTRQVSHPEMPAMRVLQVLDALDASGMQAWVDGGWGVDALVRQQTRPHKDLDLVVALEDVDAVLTVLARLGFALALDERPTRLELYDHGGRKIGLHTVSFRADGGGVQVLQDGTEFVYRRDGFAAKGRIGESEVRCLSPEVQLECHLGYEPDADDFHDMQLLKERFGLELPPPFD